jgi:hypothetical protein
MSSQSKASTFAVTFGVFVSILTLALASPVAAQGFGTADAHATTVNWTAFKPLDEDTSFIGSHTDGTVYCDDSSDPYLYAPIGMGDLPNGVVLDSVTMFFYDNLGTNPPAGYDMTVKLCRSWVDTDDGSDPDSECFATVTHTDDTTTGNRVASVTSLDEDIFYQFDVDSDSDMETVNYYLRVEFGTTTGDYKLRQVRFLWNRQVSPAPATATFSDVPTTHWAFKWVEALYAAGITHGCGGGNFCPTSSVTRAEMAVFLAEALGLHYDAEN